ncbi:hypothetical protein CDG76_24150 [Nostoc sp. 'Peltigera membranacea cyanobiont' 210A]|nr:hypothetical protein CDG76_24150 [Nostoc sp. 'Peltigera membranacea cyanobiont' 210A]
MRSHSLDEQQAIHQKLTPLNPPNVLGGNRKSSSLPFIRGGLGWGKTLVNQLFQTYVYTVVIDKRELKASKKTYIKEEKIFGFCSGI